MAIEGPRFSSKAESKMFRMWGGDIINMTAIPEVVLANELSLCYAAIAMVTDYDCWKDDCDPVSTIVTLQHAAHSTGYTSMYVNSLKPNMLVGSATPHTVVAHFFRVP